jgi:hypothetical protein
MEVMVFKTTVETPGGVRQLKPLLDSMAGNNKWNFALDDCDRILRILSPTLAPQEVIHLLTDNGFQCTELED